MYLIHGEFSQAKGKFIFTTRGNEDESKLKIEIKIPDGNLNAITLDNLDARDQKWLIITSPNDWVIDQGEMKIRFGLKSAEIPNFQIEFAASAKLEDGWVKLPLPDESLGS